MATRILFTIETSVMCGYSTWVNQSSFYRVNSFTLTNRLCKPWRFTKEHAKFYVHLQIYSIHYQHKKSFFTNHPRKDAINSFRKKTKHLFYISSNGCPSHSISDVFRFIMVLDARHWYSNDLLFSTPMALPTLLSTIYRFAARFFSIDRQLIPHYTNNSSSSEIT